MFHADELEITQEDIKALDQLMEIIRRDPIHFDPEKRLETHPAEPSPVLN